MNLLPPTAKSVIFMTAVRILMADLNGKNDNDSDSISNSMGYELLFSLSSLGFVWLDMYTIRYF